MTKKISISDWAYTELKNMKTDKNKSFSDVIDDLIQKNQKVTYSKLNLEDMEFLAELIVEKIRKGT